MTNANNQAIANTLTDQEYATLVDLLSRADLRGFASTRTLNRAGHPKVSLSVLSRNGGVNAQGYPKRQWLNRIQTVDGAGQAKWGWALGNEMLEKNQVPTNQAPVYQPPVNQNYNNAPMPVA